MRTQCPSCSGWLYFPSWEQWRADSQAIACGRCRYKFAVAPFQATRFSVRDASTPTARGLLQRQYEVCGYKPNGNLVNLQFERREAASAARGFSAFEGDLLIAIWALGRTHAPLAAVENERSGQRFRVFGPRHWARKQGAFAALLVVLAPLAFGLELPERASRQLLWASTTAPAAAGAGVLMARYGSYRERDPQNWQRLRDGQARMGRRYALGQSASEMEAERTKLADQKARVQQRKERLDPNAGQDQADWLGLYQRALVRLEEMIEVSEQLRASYRAEAERLAGEGEVEALADNLGHSYEKRLAELEQRRQELAENFEADGLLDEGSEA